MANHQVKNKYQIFDIKQLAEMEKRQKATCRQALLEYKIWRNNFKKQSDQLEIYYGKKEGLILRRHALNTMRNYWRIRNHFRQAFKTYLSQNCVVQNY